MRHILVTQALAHKCLGHRDTGITAVTSVQEYWLLALWLMLNASARWMLSLSTRRLFPR